MNRHTEDPARLEIDLRAFGDLVVAEQPHLGGGDLDAVNSIETPGRIAPTAGGGARLEKRRLTASLPPVSWNVIRLVPRGRA